MHEEKIEKAKEMLGEGAEQARKIAEDIGEKIKSNPWPYIAGAAAVAFFLGFFMRGSRRE